MTHTAQSLFDKNIESAKACLALYDGVVSLQTSLSVDWVLRAAVVFVVSALDTYFHDKVRYRVGRYSIDSLPPALAKMPIRIGELTRWENAKRKGNVLRNWVTEDLSVKPLQSPNAIADALKLCGIDSLWNTVEPNKSKRDDLLQELNETIKRRNQISHEGDRMQSRKSGKKLREIDRLYAARCIDFAKELVGRIETCFPA
jgi:hypothetical protein